MEGWGRSLGRLERGENGFDSVIREGIPEEVTFEKTPKWSERASWGRSGEEELWQKELHVRNREAA